jgi:hypothetical protein
MDALAVVEDVELRVESRDGMKEALHPIESLRDTAL